MENLKELSQEELQNIDGGIIEVLAFALSVATVFYNLGAACTEYDRRHNL